MNLVQEIIQYFKLTALYEETQVLCPYHEDKHPSASINIKKQVFYCFAGCGGKTFQQLYEDLINNGTNGNQISSLDYTNLFNNKNVIFPNMRNNRNEKMNDKFNLDLLEILSQQTGSSINIKEEISDEDIISHLRNLILSKGVSSNTLSIANAIPIINKTESLFGYIKFPARDNGSFVARKFLPDDVVNGPRYQNSSGDKSYFGEITEEEQDYILVEGIFDYLSLIENGYPNTICNLGTALDKKRAYKFKGKTVFILFDNDYAGFEGAQKAYNVLRSIGATPIILDLLPRYGKDINEAIVNNKEETLRWLSSYIEKYDSSDEGYIESFKVEPNMYTLRTGLTQFDNVLKGGFKSGIHGFAAKPSVGKTALALFLCNQLIKLNMSNVFPGKRARGLFVEYEVPKKQCWARLASMYDERDWASIEIDSQISDSTTVIMDELSKDLKIVEMWTMEEVVRAMRNYDFLVIDYIQLTPGETTDARTNVERNMRILSKLRMEQGKIIFVISTMPRSAYDKEDISVFKESGNVEFAIQSGFLLTALNPGVAERMVKVSVLKNTRGPVGGSFWLEGRMDHKIFREINPEF